MFALAATRFDDADPLAGLGAGDGYPEPDAPAGWEVVQVRAASLNHHDLWSLRGVGLAGEQLPMILGCDAAGVTAGGREVVVHAVVAGDGNGEERPGSPDLSILSERYPGTHAERVAVPRRNLLDKPAELSFAEAACLPTAWLTAYRMLFTQASVRPGDRVLVQGAGGGVATASLLLGRAAGLRVYVTSRDGAKRERALEFGAAGAYPPGARLPERVHAVMETVGEATWAHSLRCLEPGGTLVVAGATSGANPPADLRRMFFRQLRVVGSTMGTRRDFEGLLGLLQTSGVRPLIDSTFALGDGRRAYERLAGGDVFGKLVLVGD